MKDYMIENRVECNGDMMISFKFKDNHTTDDINTDETTYWNSDMAKKGIAVLVRKARNIHLLIPDNFIFTAELLNDNVKNVKMSFGLNEIEQRKMFDILFPDGSPNPFFLQMSEDQFVGFLPGQHIKYTLKIWNRDGLIQSLPLRYKKVKTIWTA